MTKKSWYLGHDESDRYFLEDFTWDCGWYWGGGYLEVYRGYKTKSTGPDNQHRMHTHFDSHLSTLGDGDWFKVDGGKFIRSEDTRCNWFDGFKKHIPYTVLTDDEIWRLCDLMIQFYAYRRASECFQYGGHYSSKGRTRREIRKPMERECNKQIEKVIIPLVRELLDKTADRPIPNEKEDPK